MIRYIVGDVRDVLDSLPEQSVDLCFSSPPFLALRNYLPDDDPAKPLEIGSEGTPAEFVDVMLDVTARVGRVLAPHGSHCFEFGDTYSGSGGAGGDYDEGGMRAGQAEFSGSAAGGRRSRAADEAAGILRPRPRPGPGARDEMEGWPLDKSLALIPELYRIALAYGINPLTGQPSPAGRWRIRNVVRWVRSNPPVGALGDKFRPATSEIAVATRATDRWFDLDAVRGPASPGTNPRTAKGIDTRENTGKVSPDGNRQTLAIQHLSATAPPLDWWVISPSGYKGSHYATFPPELCIRPIEAMCPRRVCRECGQPSRREVRVIGTGQNTRKGEPDDPRQVGAVISSDVPEQREAETVGWSDCGCGNPDALWHPDAGQVFTAIAEVRSALRRRGITKAEKAHLLDSVLPKLYDELAPLYLGRIDGFHEHERWRPGVVLDPFAGTGTTLLVAHGHGRDSIGIDLDHRNVALAEERIGRMWLTVEEHTPDAARG